MNGVINFLLDTEDVRADYLRRNFVFKLVPMINPDGVFKGHYRVDTKGQNLNRYYLQPSQHEQPTIYAIKEYIQSIKQNLLFYMDLHAHLSKKGCFVYGNHTTDFLKQINMYTLAKLISLNCKNFDFPGSIFSEKGMKEKDKQSKLTKEGCGRVAVYNLTSIPYCYTLEASYYCGRFTNQLSQHPSIKEDLYSDNKSEIYMQQSLPVYTIPIYEDMGRGIMCSILDLLEIQQASRIFFSEFKNLQGVKVHVAQKIINTIPFRFDTFYKKLVNDKQMLISYLEGSKIKVGKNGRLEEQEAYPPLQQHLIRIKIKPDQKLSKPFKNAFNLEIASSQIMEDQSKQKIDQISTFKLFPSTHSNFPLQQNITFQKVKQTFKKPYPLKKPNFYTSSDFYNQQNFYTLQGFKSCKEFKEPANKSFIVIGNQQPLASINQNMSFSQHYNYFNSIQSQPNTYSINLNSNNNSFEFVNYNQTLGQQSKFSKKFKFMNRMQFETK